MKEEMERYSDLHSVVVYFSLVSFNLLTHYTQGQCVSQVDRWFCAKKYKVIKSADCSPLLLEAIAYFKHLYALVAIHFQFSLMS